LSPPIRSAPPLRVSTSTCYALGRRRPGTTQDLCQFVGGGGFDPLPPVPIWLRAVECCPARPGTPPTSRTSPAGLEGPPGGSAPRGHGDRPRDRASPARFWRPRCPPGRRPNTKAAGIVAPAAFVRISVCGGLIRWRHLLGQKPQGDMYPGDQA
jgi:hypothetical protein